MAASCYISGRLVSSLPNNGFPKACVTTAPSYTSYQICAAGIDDQVRTKTASASNYWQDQCDSQKTANSCLNQWCPQLVSAVQAPVESFYCSAASAFAKGEVPKQTFDVQHLMASLAASEFGCTYSQYGITGGAGPTATGTKGSSPTNTAAATGAKPSGSSTTSGSDRKWVALGGLFALSIGIAAAAL